MYSNIVFMVETPILERYIEIYGIEYLRNSGFSVTILDLSPLILPSSFHGVRANLCDYDAWGFQRIFTYKELNAAFKALDSKNTLLINAMGYRYDYRKVYRLAAFYHLHFCYFMEDMNPASNVAYGRSWREKLQPTVFFNALKGRIPKPLHFTGCYADFIIGGGGDAASIAIRKKWMLCKPNCPIYYFHSPNYDECLKVSQMDHESRGDYCVFIDQYLPYHPDMQDIGASIEAEVYYSMLNCFFDEVEQLYGIKVIIAAHPRSDYDAHPGCYGDREILKDKTCELISHAKFVIQHFSNSSAFIALLKKPTLLIMNSDLNHVFGVSTDLLCRTFGWKQLNLEDWFECKNKKEELDLRLTVDHTRYDAYVRDFMRKDYDGTLNTEPLWQQISRFLKER